MYVCNFNFGVNSPNFCKKSLSNNFVRVWAFNKNMISNKSLCQLSPSVQLKNIYYSESKVNWLLSKHTTHITRLTFWRILNRNKHLYKNLMLFQLNMCKLLPEYFAWPASLNTINFPRISDLELIKRSTTMIGTVEKFLFSKIILF